MKVDTSLTHILPLVRRALEEGGSSDWATDLCIPAAHVATAEIKTEEPMTVAGLDVVSLVLQQIDPKLVATLHVIDGAFASAGSTLVTIEGHTRSLLKSQKVALGFMAHMSGVATLTRKYVDALSNTETQLLEALQGTPGLRILEKAALMIGGARHNRFGLSQSILVTTNHVQAAGGIAVAVAGLLESLSPTLKIAVEVETLAQVQEALDAGADLLLLREMPFGEMEMAVRTARGRSLFAAAGRISLDAVPKIAALGMHFISAQAILESAIRPRLVFELKV